MGFFSYTALSSLGKKSTGLLQAPTKEEAQKILSKQELLVIRIEEEKKHLPSSLSKKKVLLFFEQLSRLLQAKLPLLDSLSFLQQKQKDRNSHFLILDLIEQVEQGNPLSSAMEKHKDSFDMIYIQMIKNGEQQGNLSVVVQEIAQNIKQQLYLKQKIISALIYPLLLITFCGVVVSTLLFYVVPSLAPLFEGRELHLLTQSVFWVSDMACQNSSILWITLGLFLTGNLAAIYTQPGKRIWRRVLFHLPIVRRHLLKIGAVRFSKSMHSLLLSGMTLVDALSHSAAILSYPYLIHLVTKVRNKILEGESLSSTLKEAPSPFSDMGRMISISEESGDLPAMFDHISQMQQEEIEESLQKFTTLLQPVLLLTLGLIIGCVILAILLPLCDAGSILDF